MRKVLSCTCDPQTFYECGRMDSEHCDQIVERDCAELALCAGRHSIPQAVDGAIFEDEIDDPTDVLHLELVATRKFRALGVKYVDVYVTGLTVALVASLNAARRCRVSVNLYHFDKTTGRYYLQGVV